MEQAWRHGQTVVVIKCRGWRRFSVLSRSFILFPMNWPLPDFHQQVLAFGGAEVWRGERGTDWRAGGGMAWQF